MSKMSKFFTLLLVISFIMICSVSFVYADDVDDAYDEGYNDGYNKGKSISKAKEPIIRIVNEDKIPEVKAGEEIDFEVKYKNDSEYSAYKIVVTPQIENDDVLLYERPLYYKSLSGLHANKENTTNFKIRVKDTAKIGTYTLKVKFEYQNGRGETFERTENLYYRVSEEYKKPILTLKNIKNSKGDLKRGDEFTLSFDLDNIGGSVANEVEVNLSGFSSKSIVPINLKDYAYITEIKSDNSKNVSFDLIVSNEADEANSTLVANITYKDRDSKEYTIKKEIYYNLNLINTKPLLNITNVDINKDVISYGDEIEASFVIENIGDANAKDVEVNLSGFANDEIMPVNSKDSNYFANIKAGEKVKDNYVLKISPNIIKKDNTITVSVSYKDKDGKEFSVKKEIYVTGVNINKEKEEEEKDTSPKPKMIISNYNISNPSIVAGEEFTFNFTFRNTSKVKSIRNIKIDVSSKEGCFIITKGSNTFYIETMGKNTSLSRSIDLRPKQDLTSNSYELHLTFEFEDYDGNDYSSTEIINIPVTEYSKLVINNVSVGEASVGSNTNLSFEYVNMGKAQVSNLQASVEGDYESVLESNYIGNLTHGSSDYNDIEVKPTKEGQNIGTLVLSFEDSSGRVIEVKKEFEGFASPEEVMPEFNMDDMMMPEDIPSEEEIPVWQIVLAGIGSFLIVFFIAKAITKKIILKKMEDDM